MLNEYINLLAEFELDIPLDVADITHRVLIYHKYSITGFNTLFIDERDPYAHGFQVV